MGYFYFHTQKDEALSRDSLFEMPSIAEAESQAVDFLVASARDKIGRHSDCRELICILKNLDGKALTRVSLVLQIEPL